MRSRTAPRPPTPTKALLLAFALCGAASAPAAGAAERAWTLRAHVVRVVPHDRSDPIAGIGSRLAVGDDTVPGVDVVLPLGDRWALASVFATTHHAIRGAGGLLAGVPIGETRTLPPTVTLLYRVPTRGRAERLHPYLGAGLNYTWFHDTAASPQLRTLGVADLDFTDSFGPVAQAGLDVDLSGPWLASLDVKRLRMSTEIGIELADGRILDTVDLTIDPWVVSFGVGYRF